MVVEAGSSDFKCEALSGVVHWHINTVRAMKGEPMDIRLLPCPFCGKTESLMFTDAKELEGCKKFEDDSCPCYEEEPKCFCRAIVCSVSKGGCGASSGYATTVERVLEKWNRRANE